MQILDLDRLVQEAIGEYVGARVYNYWHLIDEATKGAIAHDPSLVLNAARFYDKEMKKTVFGYTEESFAGERPTTTPMPSWLMNAIDGIILEGKIPKRAADSALLQKLMEIAREK